jgi:hypothetical protein
MNTDGSDACLVAAGGRHYVPAWQVHPDHSGDDE